MKHYLRLFHLTILMIFVCNYSIGQEVKLPQDLLIEFSERFNLKYQFDNSFRMFVNAVITNRNHYTAEELDNIVEKLPTSKQSQQIIFQACFDLGNIYGPDGVYAVLKTLYLSASKARTLKDYIVKSCDSKYAKESRLVRESINATSNEEINYPTSNSIEKPENSTEGYYYIIKTDKSYFYNEPQDSTKRKGYLIMGERIFGTKSVNGFVFTVFTNAAGKKSVGWIKLSDIEKE